MSTGDTDPRGGVAHRGPDLTECGTWETTGLNSRAPLRAPLPPSRSTGRDRPQDWRDLCPKQAGRPPTAMTGESRAVSAGLW